MYYIIMNYDMSMCYCSGGRWSENLCKETIVFDSYDGAEKYMRRNCSNGCSVIAVSSAIIDFMGLKIYKY